MNKHLKYLVVGAAVLVASALSLAEDAIPKHQVLAREFLANTKPENNSHALRDRHTDMPSDGAGKTYVVHTDCIGFIEEVLRRSYGSVPQPLTKKFKTRWSIIDYVNSANQGAIFTKIDKVADLKPGDIVMWRYSDTNDKIPEHANGHALLIDSVPEKVSGFLSKSWSYTQYRVRIIDSSDYPKGSSDPRNKSAGRTGVGGGTINLLADDKDGSIQGVDFDQAKSNPRYQGKDLVIVMARP